MGIQPAAEDPHAGVHGLLNHRVCGIGHGGQILLGEGHRALVERDQIPRHFTTPFSAHCLEHVA
jgi:hypothetical protein